MPATDLVVRKAVANSQVYTSFFLGIVSPPFGRNAHHNNTSLVKVFTKIDKLSFRTNCRDVDSTDERFYSFSGRSALILKIMYNIMLIS